MSKIENVVEISQLLASPLQQHSSTNGALLSPLDCMNRPQLHSTHDHQPQRKFRILTAQLQQAHPLASHVHSAFLVSFSKEIMIGYYPVDGWSNKLTQHFTRELQMKRFSFPPLPQGASTCDRSANFSQCCYCDRASHHCTYFQDVYSRNNNIMDLFHYNESFSIKIINRGTETICLQLHSHIRKYNHFLRLRPFHIIITRHYLTPGKKSGDTEDSYNIAQFITFLLLLLAGDVELNPGPGK